MEILNKIHLTNNNTIKVKKSEMETKPTMVVCVNSETREGLVIPMSSILYIADGEHHEEQDY